MSGNVGSPPVKKLRQTKLSFLGKVGQSGQSTHTGTHKVSVTTITYFFFSSGLRAIFVRLNVMAAVMAWSIGDYKSNFTCLLYFIIKQCQLLLYQGGHGLHNSLVNIITSVHRMAYIIQMPRVLNLCCDCM